MSRKSLVAVFLPVALVGLLLWGCVREGIVSVHIAFAEEQTQIFEEMVVKASSALSKSPPEVAKAVEYLECVHTYYPSGTKQVAGSPLDRIVERSRKSCERRMIDMLRKVADRDIGDSPEEWIKKYGSPARRS